MFTVFNVYVMSATNTPLTDKKINNLIIKNPNRKQSCPLTVVNSKKYEPRIDSLISRKTTQEKGKPSDGDLEEFLTSSFDWLRPGLSIPKFRDKDDIIKEVRESIRREREKGSGEGSLSEVSPTEKKKDESRIDESEVETENFFPHVDVMTRPNVVRINKARKSIDGFSECPSNIYVYSSGLDSVGIDNENESLVEKTEEEESRALKNWELWMKRRRKQHEVLCRKTNREPPDLVMNRGDERFRKAKAEKTTLHNSLIPEPDNWEYSTPYRDSRGKLIHRNVPPEWMSNEKFLYEGKTSESEFLEMSKDAGIPSIRIQEEMIDAPCHSIISEKVFQCCYPRVDVDRESTVCLVINNTELKCVYDPKTSELFMADTDINEWSLIFETSPVGTLQTKSLNIENRGTMAIRFHWKFKKPYSDPDKYPKLTRDNHAPWFYFDKNPGIFLPGQKYDFNFYHYSSTAGLHVETWVLETRPFLFNPPTEIKIVLVAVSDCDYSVDDLLAIESYVNKCVSETLAKEIVEEIFGRVFVPPVREIDYKSFFMEDELFRHQNPRHHYHSEIVEELKAIYSEIPLDPPKEWDYSLLNLHRLLNLKMEGEGKRSRICRLNELARASLKRSYVSHKSEGKYYFVYCLLSKLANQIEAEALGLKVSLPDIPYTFKEISADRLNSHAEENNEADERGRAVGIQRINSDQIKLANYYECLYTQVYHQLGLAVEQIVSIIEASKVFEHHGEIGRNLHDPEDVSKNYLNYCMRKPATSFTLKEESSRMTQ